MSPSHVLKVRKLLIEHQNLSTDTSKTHPMYYGLEASVEWRMEEWVGLGHCTDKSVTVSHSPLGTVSLQEPINQF
jgi:predicted sugar kinase